MERSTGRPWSLVLVATLAACTAKGGDAVSHAPLKASTVVLTGTVQGPAPGIISDNGGGLVSDQGGSVISNNGGALVRFGLQALADLTSPVAGARVELQGITGAAAVSQAVVTDAKGRFSFPALDLPRGPLDVHASYVAGGHALTLDALVAPGASEARVDPATTLVAKTVREQVRRGAAADVDVPAAARVAEALAAVLDKATVVQAAIADAQAASALFDRTVKANATVATAVRQNLPALATSASPGPAVPSASPSMALGPGPSFGLMTTIAGSGEVGFGGDGGPASAAALHSPGGVAIAADGTIYLADIANFRLRKLDPAGTISTFAGTGTSGAGGDGGPATAAQLSRPSALALDAAGALYIADEYNNKVRKIATNGTITTVAGTGGSGLAGDGGPATQATLYDPAGLAFAKDGTLFVADSYNDAVRAIAPDGTISTRAHAHRPTGLAVSPAGDLYVSLPLDHQVVRVAADGSVTTVAGTGMAGFSGDLGPAVTAQLDTPTGLACDSSGVLYIADQSNHRIRAVAADGTIRTVAGTGTPPGSATFSGDGGPALAATLYHPSDLAWDPKGGRLLITDAYNHRLRAARP